METLSHNALASTLEKRCAAMIDARDAVYNAWPDTQTRLSDIVAALGVDHAAVIAWRRACAAHDAAEMEARRRCGPVTSVCLPAALRSLPRRKRAA